jgi:hypothetical protein
VVNWLKKGSIILKILRKMIMLKHLNPILK